MYLLRRCLNPEPNGLPDANSIISPQAIAVRIRGALGDIDPLNKVPFRRAISRAIPSQQCDDQAAPPQPTTSDPPANSLRPPKPETLNPKA